MALYGKNPESQKEGKSHDEQVSDVMDASPSEFLASMINSFESMPIATIKREAKKAALIAGMQESMADLDGDRFERKKWSKVRNTLRYAK